MLSIATPRPPARSLEPYYRQRTHHPSTRHSRGGLRSGAPVKAVRQDRIRDVVRLWLATCISKIQDLLFLLILLTAKIRKLSSLSTPFLLSHVVG